MQAAPRSRQISLRLTERDLVEAQHLLLRATFRNPVRLGLLAALWCGATVFVALLFRSDLPAALPAAFALAAFAAAAMVFGLPVLIVHLLSPRAARRTLRLAPGLQGDLHYSWSETGFACDADAGSSLTHWAAYRRWLENEKLLLIWPGPKLYQVLPKRVLDPAQIDEIRAFLIAAREERSGT